MTQTRRTKEEVEREIERIERFRRIASRRANKALEYMDALVRTANRKDYSYTEEQTQEILSKLRQGVDQLAAAYSGQGQAKLRVEI